MLVKQVINDYNIAVAEAYYQCEHRGEVWNLVQYHAIREQTILYVGI